MLQSKTYLKTGLDLITMLVCLLVEIDLFNDLFYYGLANKKHLTLILIF